MTELYILELRVLPTTILILMILGYGGDIDLDSDDAGCWLVNLGTALAAASCFRKSRRKCRFLQVPERRNYI
uniref:Secreted protein n=1 Tax=Panagrellus redivivus TaxID=6233 RepID=A0A7E4ZZM5_PANRE